LTGGRARISGEVEHDATTGGFTMNNKSGRCSDGVPHTPQQLDNAAGILRAVTGMPVRPVFYKSIRGAEITDIARHSASFATDLASLLRQNPRTLEVSFASLSPGQRGEFLGAIEALSGSGALSNLRALRLDLRGLRDDFGDEDLQRLLAAIDAVNRHCGNRVLIELDFAGSRLGDVKQEMLSNVLSRPNRIKSILLPRDGITDDGAARLTRAAALGDRERR
jgi:hypothetical protein